MANKYKNERLINIGGVEILLRPTFENLASFETNVITLDQFSFNLVKGKMPSLSQIIQAIFYFQAVKEFNLEQINQMVIEANGIQIFSQVAPFLSSVTAGYMNKKDVDEAADKAMAMTEAEKKS